MKRALIIASIIVLPASLAGLWGVPHASSVGVLVTAALLWMTEIIPAGATGLLVPVMISLLGISPAVEAFSTFSNHIVFLILGSMLLVRAMQETRVDLYLAHWLLRLSGEIPARGVALVLSAFTWFTGMWMSNTACALLFLPVVLGVLRSQEHHLPEEPLKRLQCHLLFSVAFIPSIGGMLTPIGSLPNAVALGFLEKHGEAPSFLEWFASVSLLSLLLVTAIHLILSFRYPLSDIALERSGASGALAGARKLSSDGRKVLGVAVLAVLLWVLPGAVASYHPGLKEVAQRIPLGVASLCIVLLLFIIPRSSHRDDSQRGLLAPDALCRVDFNILGLFGGGLALGRMLETTGVAAWIGSYLDALGAWVPGGVPLMLVLITIVLSEIGSNTASASVMVPIALAVSPELGIQKTVMGVALASGLGAMLPVSTPPNAIVYSTGKVSLSDMIRTGLWCDLLGAALVYLWLVRV